MSDPVSVTLTGDTTVLLATIVSTLGLVLIGSKTVSCLTVVVVTTVGLGAATSSSKISYTLKLN